MAPQRPGGRSHAHPRCEPAFGPAGRGQGHRQGHYRPKRDVLCHARSNVNQLTDQIDSERPGRPCGTIAVECKSLVHTSTRRYRRVDRRDLLERLRGRTWRHSELLATICDNYGCAESTARRNVSLALRSGYLARGPDGYHMTTAAEAQLREYGRLHGLEGMRFARYCSGRPGLGLGARNQFASSRKDSG